MDEGQINGRIERLVAEGHELWEREARGEGSDGERARLDALKVTLDQCWDLLRQRRALDAAGLDAEVVEHYQQ